MATKEEELIEQSLKAAGFEFRRCQPGEEGGIFYYENGVRKKFTENIFVKRSIKFEEDENNESNKQDKVSTL